MRKRERNEKKKSDCVYIDEERIKLYLSEMMKNRVLAFDLEVSTGSLSNQIT